MKRIIIFFSFLLTTAFSFAQTADEIIEKHVKAMGGREKWESIQSLKFSGINRSGTFEFPFTQVKKKPGCFRMELTIQGLTMLQVYDGRTKTGWAINPFGGSKEPQKWNAEQTKAYEDVTDMKSDLMAYKEKGNSVYYLGVDDLEGVEVYKIMLAKKDKTIIYYYIDIETFYILKETTKFKFEDKEIESDSYFSNFKTVEGIVIPFSEESKNNGQIVNQVTFSKVELNVPVNDSIFVMPAKKGS
jgi:hypothetical protein